MHCRCSVAVLGLFELSACTGPPGPDLVVAAFPTPWEHAQPTLTKLVGGFSTHLGAEVAGAGWYRSPTIEVQGFADAALHDVQGASRPVVQLRLGGRDEQGVHLLELDVAANHWVAGPIPVDGTAAVGVLTTPDGITRFLVGGEVRVTAAGMHRGQAVAGTVHDLVLGEAKP